jgi:CheY-like chemotaxis protein
MATILLVEDDVVARAMLITLLKNAGHGVEEATDGKSGLQKAGQLLPELVILDIKLPEMDGWEVCRRLKKTPKTAKIPVLMLTSYTRQVEAYQGYEAGADSYLTKPWEPKRVLEEVGRLLPLKTYQLPE